jgi:hypothetical protein
MARYLQRLVARAGAPAEAVAAAPSPRPQSVPVAGDPFEATASWPVDVPAKSASSHLTSSRPSAPDEPQARIATRTFPTSIESNATHVHIHPPQESLSSASAISPPHAEPDPVVQEHTVREIESPAPAANAVEREIRTERLRERVTLEQTAAPVEIPLAARAPQQSESPKPADVERNVLARLMPVLNEWFASDSAAASPSLPDAATRAPPVIQPPPQDRPPVVSSPSDSPSVVIGSIHVEVVPSSVPVSAPAPRIRVTRSQSNTPAQSASRHRFGLGQM